MSIFACKCCIVVHFIYGMVTQTDILSVYLFSTIFVAVTGWLTLNQNKKLLARATTEL